VTTIKRQILLLLHQALSGAAGENYFWRLLIFAAKPDWRGRQRIEKGRNSLVTSYKVLSTVIHEQTVVLV